MPTYKDAPSDINETFRHYTESPGDKALEAVIKSGEALVTHFASIYGGGCCFDDLYQSGMLGLFKAVKTYRSGKTGFMTWASWCIIGEVRHFVRSERKYYYPKYIEKLQENLDNAIDDYIKGHESLPDAGYLAGQAGIPADSVKEVMRAGLVSFSEIDASIVQPEIKQSFEQPIEDEMVIDQAFEMLGELQKKVLKCLFYKGMTQEQTAEELGLSQRKVSRIKIKSLDTMAKIIDGPDFSLLDNSNSFKLIKKSKKK